MECISVTREKLPSCIGKTWAELCAAVAAGEAGFADSKLAIAGPGYAHLRPGAKGGPHEGGWTVYSQGW